MPRNIEIKAYVDDLASVRAKAKELSKSDGQEIIQRDTFFNSSQGRLKLRYYLAGRDAELIFYNRPDQEGPKLSDYHIVKTNAPDDLSKVLEGAIGIRGEVRKTRWLYMVGQTRVHCDSVENLGDFAELEVCLEDDQTLEDGQKIAEDLMTKLGIDKSKLISGAYMDLLNKKSKE